MMYLILIIIVSPFLFLIGWNIVNNIGIRKFHEQKHKDKHD